MEINEAFDFLNFWINKKTGAWYSIQELELITDRGQLSLYSDMQPKWATSEHVKDALAPFREKWDFVPADTISGYIPIPSNLNFLNLLDVTVNYTVSNITRYAPVKMYNEDEIGNRLNSQIDPVTTTSPIGEVVATRLIRLYPQGSGYTGTAKFLRRPVKPVMAYTLISGRTIVYDAANSVQLEWPENWQNAVLLKALSSIGINLSSDEVSQWSEQKTQQNFGNANRT